MPIFYFYLSWLLESCNTSDFLYVPPPPFFFKYYCAVIQYHTNCNNSYLCNLQQKNDVSANLLNDNGSTIQYSTNVNWDRSKGCNYYLSDVKSDCNKRVFFLIAYAWTFTHVCMKINSLIERNINPVSSIKYQCRSIIIWSVPRAFQLILNCQPSYIWTY